MSIDCDFVPVCYVISGHCLVERPAPQYPLVNPGSLVQPKDARQAKGQGRFSVGSWGQWRAGNGCLHSLRNKGPRTVCVPRAHMICSGKAEEMGRRPWMQPQGYPRVTSTGADMSRHDSSAHLHGPAPLHITSPGVTRKSLWKLAPSGLCCHHLLPSAFGWCWCWLAAHRGSLLAVSLPRFLSLAHLTLRCAFHLNSFPCFQPSLRLKISISSQLVKYTLHCVYNETQSTRHIRHIRHNSHLGTLTALSRAPPRAHIDHSVTARQPGPPSSICYVDTGWVPDTVLRAVRYWCAITYRCPSRVHSFLRAPVPRPHHPSPITATVDHGQPTTQTLPRQDHTHFPPVASGPHPLIVHNNLLAPALGPFRIASPGRLYRTTFASLYSPSPPT
ncbi:hypothetical protein B0T20DRAFT_488656 [Sordaria brevicollis]|uniref:Uncharacterized protein n=1 Tax=Sordaria brevicollis TaxID=83679 RepID=A0AAE0P1P6_SORBR|nr:hypothetical protein B0T20DRAFT_488656 [Sordaria brevicollis]